MSLIKPAASIEEIAREAKAHKSALFPTRFKFLEVVNGVRPGLLSGLMGTSGSGKSTLSKAIIVDAASKGSKVLVWLSEESVKEYQIGLQVAAKEISVLKNIFFVEEKSIDGETLRSQEKFFECFNWTVLESDCDLVVIDNITTSSFYNDDIGPDGQTRSGIFLARAPKELGVGVFFIAHTKKSVVDNQSQLITREDIRGSLKVNMMAEYLFILQKFTGAGVIYPIMQISKHRFHEVRDKFYLLKYENQAYMGDVRIEFSLVNKIFKLRDTLGGGL